MGLIPISMAVGSALLNRQATKSANKQTRLATAKQMAFQQYNSDTSYQRGMQDMQKAGLNPILAGKMGGASTPTGASYVAQKSDPVGSASQAIQQNHILQQTANQSQQNALTQMDIDYLRRKKLSPMQLKHSPVNITGTQIEDGISNALEDFKKKIQKNRKYNKENPASRKYNNMAPYETPYSKNKAKNPTGSRGSGKYLPKRVKSRTK
jgi:hypothetical protein